MSSLSSPPSLDNKVMLSLSSPFSLDNFCHSWSEITTSIISSLYLGFLFQQNGFFHTDMSFSLFFSCFCYELVAMSSYNFFMGFRMGNLNDKF